MGEPALIEHQWYWKANSQECFFLVLLKYWKWFHLLNYIFTVCISFISESMAIWSFIRDSLVKQWGNKRAQFSSPLCRVKHSERQQQKPLHIFPAQGTAILETLQCTNWYRGARQCTVKVLNKGIFFCLRKEDAEAFTIVLGCFHGMFVAILQLFYIFDTEIIN